jgi:outer membrane protein TolC
MNARMKLLAVGIFFLAASSMVRAQSGAQDVRRLTLHEAVQMALKQNHLVRIAEMKIEEKQHAKDVARSAYFPTISNQSALLHVTDTQFIQIAPGSLGTVNGTPIPTQAATLNQGGRTLVTSGTGLVQPLTQLFTKVKPANDIARADLDATRANAKQTENEIALKVHQLYYSVLIAQLHLSASEARIKATEALKSERVQQVKYGSALDQDLIESTAQYLQAKQELLTTELLLSNLTMQLNDVVGLPLTTRLALEAVPAEELESCKQEECVKIALESHPEVVAAREELQKASAGVKLSKADYIPDLSAFARYSYSDQVPFLARNFGSFGVEFTYELFDGGRRRAKLAESNAQLAQARENLARVTDEVELQVQIAYNKLQRTRELVNVSKELLDLRTEVSRVSGQQLEKGEALQSQAENAVAQKFDAQTSFLQAQLDYIQAHDEMTEAMGITPQ